MIFGQKAVVCHRRDTETPYFILIFSGIIYSQWITETAYRDTGNIMSFVQPAAVVKKPSCFT